MCPRIKDWFQSVIYNVSISESTEMLWGERWEGGSCLGTHVRIKDLKIKKKSTCKINK